MGDKKKKVSIKSKHIEEFLRKKLDKKSFKMNHPYRKDGSTFIIAEKDSLNLYIEVIGFKESTKALKRDFFEVVFKSFIHLENQDARYSIIALPIEYLAFLRKEISKIKTAWVRICIAFPELRLYFIDLNENRIVKKKLVEIINDDEVEI